jgi:hypothetical protein
VILPVERSLVRTSTGTLIEAFTVIALRAREQGTGNREQGTVDGEGVLGFRNVLMYSLTAICPDH